MLATRPHALRSSSSSSSTRHRTWARQLSVVPINSTAGPPFYPEFREYEINRLKSLRNKAPTEILTIVGPRNCGKTVLLNHCFPEDKEHVLFMDCREHAGTTPDTLLSYLLAKVMAKTPTDAWKRTLEVFGAMGSAAGGGSKITKKTESTDSLEFTVEPVGILRALVAALSKPRQAAQADLDAVTDAFSELLDAWKKTLPEGEWPVIVIDEANVMLKWTAEQEFVKDSLLNFFVAITKTKSRCHVLLASSEYSYLAWLNNAIGPGRMGCEDIGDFPAADARKYLAEKLKGSSITVDDKTWAKVYEVCGGNAGCLNSLARRVEDSGANWDAALRKLSSEAAPRIRRLARGGEGYSATQYAVAAIQVLDAEHHAVPEDDMVLLLGRVALGPTASTEDALKDGTRVLLQLVEANALSVRPFSFWARDIPDEAFGEADVVVTAPATMDLYCMKRIRPQLELMVEEWEGRQKGAKASAIARATPDGDAKQ